MVYSYFWPWGQSFSLFTLLIQNGVVAPRRHHWNGTFSERDVTASVCLYHNAYFVVDVNNHTFFYISFNLLRDGYSKWCDPKLRHGKSGGLICLSQRHFVCTAKMYSRLSLSQIPRNSLKHFEISVHRNIRVAEVRKTINRTTAFNKWVCNLTHGDILKIL